MFKPQLTSVVLATLLVTAQLTSHAQATNPGASAATNAAIGGVSQGAVVAAVVGVAMVASLNSGSSGAVVANPVTLSAVEAVVLANTALTKATASNAAASSALDLLADSGATGPAFEQALSEARTASANLTTAVANAAVARSNLDAASKVGVVGVVNNGVKICEAANFCTTAEVRALQLRAVELMKEVGELNRIVILKIQTVIAEVRAMSNFDTAKLNAALLSLDVAVDAFFEVQTATNQAIQNYNTASSGTVLTPSTGTIPASGTTGSTGT